MRRAIGIVIVVLSACLIAFPHVAGFVAKMQAESHVSAMESVYEPLEDPERIAVLEQAQAYNRWLAGEPNDNVLPYAEQLRFHSVPAMAWIEFDRLGVKLPIYHGTSDAVLSAGAGHIDVTSLPVGGESSHCVISAHSGLVTARMFDGLEQCKVGDVFVIWTLGEPYAYRVVSVDKVLPNEVDSLRIEDGRDLCTLVTCTQPGWSLSRTNSHRLLVRGERCTYMAPVEKGGELQQALWERHPLAFAGAAMLVVSLAGGVVAALVARRKRGSAA